MPRQSAIAKQILIKIYELQIALEDTDRAVIDLMAKRDALSIQIQDMRDLLPTKTAKKGAHEAAAPLKRKTPLRAKTSLTRKTLLRSVSKKPKAKVKAKVRPVSKLLKDVERVFNRYVRERAGRSHPGGYVRCCSCAQVHHWSILDAGHYIHGCAPLRFDERNVHPQCTSCNRFRHGNQASYAIYLVQRYGPDILLEFDEIKRENSAHPKRWKRTELEQLLEIYTGKLAAIRR